MEYLIGKNETAYMSINGTETITISVNNGVYVAEGRILEIEGELFEVVEIENNEGKLKIHTYTIEPIRVIDITNN